MTLDISLEYLRQAARAAGAPLEIDQRQVGDQNIWIIIDITNPDYQIRVPTAFDALLAVTRWPRVKKILRGLIVEQLETPMQLVEGVTRFLHIEYDGVRYKYMTNAAHDDWRYMVADQLQRSGDMDIVVLPEAYQRDGQHLPGFGAIYVAEHDIERYEALMSDFHQVISSHFDIDSWFGGTSFTFVPLTPEVLSGGE